jgi:hypothetical protein
MSALTISIDVTGAKQTEERARRVAKVLQDRGPLHAAIAKDVMADTKRFLKKSASHRSASSLGATPTGFRARNAAALSARSDDTQAVLVIPRRTGLGRAFGQVVLVPGSGRTYLTLPGHKDTYGKTMRDFPEGTFQFAVIRSWISFPAMIFQADGGSHKKGEVGFWLRRTVTQKQDRTLLPSDQEFRQSARDASNNYLMSAIYNS